MDCSRQLWPRHWLFPPTVDPLWPVEENYFVAKKSLEKGSTQQVKGAEENLRVLLHGMGWLRTADLH